MADVNQQVLDALNAGYGPEDILAHMQNVAKDSPAHAAWVNNLQRQTLDVRSQQNEPDTTPDYTKPDDQRAALEAQRNALANPTQNPGGQGIKAPPSALQQFSTDVGDWYQNTPAWKKALEIGGPLALGYGIKEGIRRGASILLPTPGEKVAQEQNRISQANLELERQKLAMKGTEAPVGPTDYELARIETEKAKAEQIRASIASQAKRDELAAAKLEQQSKPKLSVEEQRLAALAEQQAQAKAATVAGMQPPAPVVEPNNPKVSALFQPPANAPAAAAATPPENMPKKAWEPPTASLALNAPATPTQTAAPAVETITTTPVTSAEPAATTKETPAPKATLEQQVKAIKETETPETKAEPAKEKAAKTAKTPKLPQPAGTGGGDNWLHSMAGPEIYADVIKRKNGNKPYGPGEASQNKAYADWKEYQNEVGRMRPYTNKPVLNLQELEKQKFKSANIEGRIPLSSVPPPSLRPNEIGQGGSLLRTLTDQLQLKQ